MSDKSLKIVIDGKPQVMHNIVPPNMCIGCMGTGRQKQYEAVRRFSGDIYTETSEKTIMCRHCEGAGVK